MEDQFMYARLLITCLLAITIASTSAAPAPAPRVVAQMYVWVQQNQERGQHLEDHLDDAFAATSRAGFIAVQGWLSWFASEEQARTTAAALAARGLVIPEAY